MGIPPTFTPPKNPKQTSNPFAPRRYGQLERVTDRVYIFRNITNSSFVIGDRSVAVIDTQVNLPTARELLRLLKTVTDKPVEYVINTHYHWDHTNGNILFKDQGAKIVSSALTKDFMVSRAPRQKEFLSGRGFELGQDPLLPEVTFQNEMMVDLGNMPLRLFFAGAAESDDATAVHVLNENVLMSGDTVMTGSFPIFGQPVWDEGLQDSVWLGTIDKLLSYRPDHIIPGHGPLASQADIQLLTRIQKFFLEEVGNRVSKGLKLSQILEEIESGLPSWITSIPVVWGTPRYAILRVWRGMTKSKNDPEAGWQRYKPSALPQPKSDAVLKTLPQSASLNEFLSIAEEAGEGGDLGLKIAVLKKATEILKTNPDAYAYFSDTLIESSKQVDSVLEKGDFFDQAKRSWQKALELNPEHVHSLLGKGRYLTMMAYRGGDDPEEGMKLLRKVVDLNPGGKQQAEAEFYLGMGYRRLGNENSAITQFKKAMSTDPGFMPARMASQC